MTKYKHTIKCCSRQASRRALGNIMNVSLPRTDAACTDQYNIPLQYYRYYCGEHYVSIQHRQYSIIIILSGSAHTDR